MWSPDSKNLIYDEGFGPIHVFSADGSNQIVLTNAALPTWSPSGEKIAFAYYNNTYYQIYAMDIKSTNKTLLADRLTSISSLAWSSDGKKIAFVLSTDNVNEIYAMNADGSNQHRLTYSKLPYSHSNVLWSPDSSRIGFYYFEVNKGVETGAFGIGIINADGTNETLIAGGKSPAWSPDGTKIAFESEAKNYLMNADGSNRTWLTNGQTPVWSPDSTKIAFESQGTIYVINSDGSNQKKLADGWAPAWSPK